MTTPRPAPTSDQPDTETAEMLALIAKVTASIAERMDGQDRALDDLRRLTTRANTQIADRVPHTLKDVEALRRELNDAKGALYRLQRSEDECEAENENTKQTLRATQRQLSDTTEKLQRWQKVTKIAAPVALVIAVTVLPTLLSLHPLTCKAMLATATTDRDDTGWYCFFYRDD